MESKFKRLWKGEDIEFREPTPVPQVFEMIRNNDESGTSGTGKVLDGVLFPNGRVVICWNATNSKATVDGEPVGSITVFDGFEEFHAIHIGSHPTNGTEINWF
jgi:hypothetical protein